MSDMTRRGFIGAVAAIPVVAVASKVTVPGVVELVIVVEPLE